MAITLIDRITTLLRAETHGVVESLEERSLLLKQYVREAEIDLNRKRARLDTVRDEERRLAESLARREDDIRSLDEDIALALGAGKEELARFAIRRLIPQRRDAQALRAQMAERAQEGHALAECVDAQQARFERLRARVRAELAREGEPAPGSAPPFEGAVADEEVELELMRRRSAEGGNG